MIFNEAKLTSLFEFQKFCSNPRLAELIGGTERRMSSPEAFALSDEDVNVWAAGDIASYSADSPEAFSESDDDED